MNPNIAKLIDWSDDDLRKYFGLVKDAPSSFRRREDFAPGVDALAMTAPMNLHVTKRHKGVYEQVEGGVPKMRSDVVAMLDNTPVPWRMMFDAYEHLRQVDNDAWLTIEAVSYKLPWESMELVAEKLGNVTRQTVYNRIANGIKKISGYLSRELERIANGESA